MSAQESFQATLEAAAEACRAQAALLEDRLEALGGGQTFNNKDMEGFVLNTKAYHCDQTALWNSFIVSESGLGKAKASAHALDGAHRYAVLQKETLFVLRPDPPCKNIQHSTKDMHRNGNTAADDYQDVRNHLKQSMKMNPLAGEMQVTVSRRMHAVPALGSVPLPKATGARHLSGTASQAAREMITSQIDSAAPLHASNQQTPVIPAAAASERGSLAAVPPWQAELRARQQSQGAGSGSTQPVTGASGSGARPSMPLQVAPGMESELQAALERRRKSAAP